MDRTSWSGLSRAASAVCLGLLTGIAAATTPPAWQVRDDAGRELWLLGSVHALREQDYPLPPLIDTLYERADVLVMEIDLDDLDPLEAQRVFIEAAVLPEETTLAARVGTELYARADAHARELGFELRLLERFEPWLVAVTLLDRSMAARGFSAEGGVERYLLGKAGSDAKPVLGLETLAEQIHVFDHLGEAEQALLFEQTLDDLDSDDDTVATLVAAWRNGELDALAASLHEDFVEFPSLYEALVVNRNEAWIDEIETLLGTDDTELVIVGALHLVGEHNVVDLLRERGFEVRPAQ